MAIAFDTKTSDYVLGSDTLTFNHTCSGDTTKLIVFVAWYDITTSSAPSVSTLTYNSVSLTRPTGAQVQFNFAGDNYVVAELWYLDNPGTGSAYQVAITLSEAVETNQLLIGVALSYEGMDTGYNSYLVATNANTAESYASDTSDASDSYIVGGISTQIEKTHTERSNVNQREETGFSEGQNAVWAGDMPATGGSDEFGTTMDSGTRWCLIGVEFPAVAGEGRTTKNTDPYGLGIAAGVSRTFKVGQL